MIIITRADFREQGRIYRPNPAEFSRNWPKPKTGNKGSIVNIAYKIFKAINDVQNSMISAKILGNGALITILTIMNINMLLDRVCIEHLGLSAETFYCLPVRSDPMYPNRLLN